MVYLALKQSLKTTVKSITFKLIVQYLMDVRVCLHSLVSYTLLVYMFKLTANLIVRTHFVVFVIAASENIRILMNIHVLLKTPQQEELFSANFTFVLLYFVGVCFKMRFKFPTFIKDKITAITAKCFMVFSLNM